jgi:hypothetical protein
LATRIKDLEQAIKDKDKTLASKDEELKASKALLSGASLSVQKA